MGDCFAKDKQVKSELCKLPNIQAMLTQANTRLDVTYNAPETQPNLKNLTYFATEKMTTNKGQYSKPRGYVAVW